MGRLQNDLLLHKLVQNIQAQTTCVHDFVTSYVLEQSTSFPEEAAMMLCSRRDISGQVLASSTTLASCCLVLYSRAEWRMESPKYRRQAHGRNPFAGTPSDWELRQGLHSRWFFRHRTPFCGKNTALHSFRCMRCVAWCGLLKIFDLLSLHLMLLRNASATGASPKTHFNLK